jgi:hypothetical protein
MYRPARNVVTPNVIRNDHRMRPPVRTVSARPPITPATPSTASKRRKRSSPSSSPAIGAKNASPSTWARAFASSAAKSSGCITTSAFGYRANHT